MKTVKTPDKWKSSPFTKVLPEYVEYAERIRKSLYYGRLPATDRPSLPFTSLSIERFSRLCCQDGIEKLDLRYASSVCYDACVTPCSLILALLYLDRLRDTNPDYLASASPSQVFLIAMMVASKYLFDDGEEDEVFNDEWATSAGLPLLDLNHAERQFLTALDWNLFVDSDTFLKTFEKVEAEIAKREGCSRGFFTYTDVVCLSHVMPASCAAMLHLVLDVFSVCLVGYTAAVVSIVAGTILAQECSYQLVDNLVQGLKSTDNVNGTSYMTENSRISFGDVGDPVSDILSDGIENLIDVEKGNKSVISLPSHVITTLTTSILLAMSSPTPPPLHHTRKKYSSNILTNECLKESDALTRDIIDPSNIRLSFTTGSYWMPSGMGHDLKMSILSTIDHCKINCPDSYSSSSTLNYGSNEDWMAMSWLSRSLVQNISLIGAPNINAEIMHGKGTGWRSYVFWFYDLLKNMAADGRVYSSHNFDHLPSPILGRVAMALS